MLTFWAIVDLGTMALRGCPHSPKSQHHWDLTIRLFSVILRTLIVGVLPLCRGEVGVFYIIIWYGSKVRERCSALLFISMLYLLKREHSGHPWLFLFVVFLFLLHDFLSNIVKVNLATVVEGDQKAPFSIASTLRCRRGRHSFPLITRLYPWYVSYIAEC